LAVRQQLDDLHAAIGDAVVSAAQKQQLATLESRYDGIVNSTLMDEYLSEMERGTITAPSLLREFYQTLRDELT
jgi:hypothetical protein